MSKIRIFKTGATRNSDDEKLDYEAFLSPLVLERYAQYMHTHRKQEDGSLRDGDNWQKGIPFSAYMKSMWRHFMVVWKTHRMALTEMSDKDHENLRAEMEDALAAVIFNASGYLHELLLRKK